MHNAVQSLSARRAWIEITPLLRLLPCGAVALRKESVDRNRMPSWTAMSASASLSARRAWIEIRPDPGRRPAALVALRKESVDRNLNSIMIRTPFWLVALRKESVDRNCSNRLMVVEPSVSLSARRAWIEIGCRSWSRGLSPVALRKESVDRNGIVPVILAPRACRSPQGERG